LPGYGVRASAGADYRAGGVAEGAGEEGEIEIINFEFYGFTG